MEQVMDQHTVSLLSATLTPITAVLALYIGFRQNRLQKEQLRLQLYERRAAVFRSYVDFLSRIVFANRVTDEDVVRYRSAIVDAQFLFEARDAQLLQDLGHGADTLPGTFGGVSPEEIEDREERTRVIRFLADRRSSYYERLREAPDRFRKYLDAEY